MNIQFALLILAFILVILSMIPPCPPFLFQFAVMVVIVAMLLAGR